MPLGTEQQAKAGPVAGVPWSPPTAQAADAEYVAARYRVRGEQAADGAGVITLRLGAPPLRSWWLIGRLVVRTNAGAATEARVYVGDVNATNEEDSTPAGNSDVSEYPRGLYVAGGATLIVVWTGAAPGDVGYASAQVAEMRR